MSIALVVSQSGGSANTNGPPSWLPKSSVPVGRVVTATAAHPWLAIEGDSVLVQLDRGRSLVTAVGPAISPAGAYPPPSTTACSFTITFARSTGVVPISPTGFTITDQNGQVHQPQVALSSGGAVPSSAPAGRFFTLSLSTVLTTGNGTLRWAPTGGRAIVAWDFTVEVD